MTLSIDDSTFVPLAELLANAAADDLQVRRQLQMPRERYVKDKTSFHVQGLKKKFLSWQTSFDMGISLLQEKLNTLSFDKKKPFVQEIREFLEGKKMPSEPFLSWLYEITYDYYENRDWPQALALFHILVTLAPTVSDFWTALGFVQRQLDQEEEALFSFSLALLLNPASATPRYQLAELYYEQKLYTEALTEISNLSEMLKDTELSTNISELENKVLSKQRGGL